MLKNEKAVSPVIGVILMVAVTVILAAVVGSFVFGLGSSMQKTYDVGVKAFQRGKDIYVTVTGGSDLGSLVMLKVDIYTDASSTPTITGYYYDDADQGTTAPTDTSGLTNTIEAGAVLLVSNVGTSGVKDRVVVTGYFLDGSQQILLDTYV